MNLGLLRRQATLVTRLYTGPPDEFGDPTAQEVTVTAPCELQGAGSHEANEDALQVSTWRLFLGPELAHLTGWDYVVVDGRRYELAGDPSPVFNPRTQTVDHVEALVQRVAEEVAA